jgi:hypothetical protein
MMVVVIMIMGHECKMGDCLRGDQWKGERGKRKDTEG